MQVGIVGCGGIARAHLRAYGENGAMVAGVCDCRREAAERFASEAQGARVFSSPAEMAGAGFFAVSVCTPPGTHFETSRPFLEAGVPVLCEKPLAADVDQAQALAALAEETGTPCMTAFCHRWHPPVARLKEMLGRGELGKPLLFRNIFSGYLDLARDHRGCKELAGGGTVIDNATHAVDVFRFLVGEPTAVSALVGNVAQEVEVDDFGLLLLETAAGCFGEVCVSHSFPVGDNRIELFGSEGTGVVTYFSPTEPEFRFRRGSDPEWTEVAIPQQPDRFAGEVAHFLQAIRAGAPLAVTAQDGLAVSRAIEAAYESGRTGARIVL